MKFLEIIDLDDINKVLKNVDLVERNEYRLFFKDDTNNIFIYRCSGGVINEQLANSLEPGSILDTYENMNKSQFAELVFKHLSNKYQDLPEVGDDN